MIDAGPFQRALCGSGAVTAGFIDDLYFVLKRRHLLARPESGGVTRDGGQALAQGNGDRRLACGRAYHPLRLGTLLPGPRCPIGTRAR